MTRQFLSLKWDFGSPSEPFVFLFVVKADGGAIYRRFLQSVKLLSPLSVSWLQRNVITRNNRAQFAHTPHGHFSLHDPKLRAFPGEVRCGRLQTCFDDYMFVVLAQFDRFDIAYFCSAI